MGKKSKKSKANVAPPPDSAKQHSESTEISMTNENSGRSHEDTSGMSKIKEDSTSSDTLRRNADEPDVHAEKSNLPEHNLDEITSWKNKCKAIKSNLKTVTKNLEDEKKEKEKLFQEIEDLKLKVSSLEKELEAAEVKIEKLEKEITHRRKSDEKGKVQSMDFDPSVAGGSVQPERKPSDENTSEKSEYCGVQDNAEESWDDPSSSGGHDIEMRELPDKDKLGQQRGSTDGWQDTDAASTDWWADQDTDSSTQPSDYHTGTVATGLPKRRNDTEHNHNDWSHQKPKNKNEYGHHGSRTYTSGQPNRYDNNYGGREGRMDNRGDRGQNFNHDVNDPNRQYNIFRERGIENRGNKFRVRGRGMENRGDRGQNYNRDRITTTDEPPVLKEIYGDLFSAPPEYSLAHCVAEDMRMGSGIAVSFRQKFRSVEELLDQGKRKGHVAVLEREGRYIYYLVTKRLSTGKPNMETLERSLEDMRVHVIEHQVKNIAMPRIGCGLDRLDWHNVRPLIEKIFKETGAQITIYKYNEGHGKHKSKERSKSGSSERNRCPNNTKSDRKKRKNKKLEKKPGKNNNKRRKRM